MQITHAATPAATAPNYRERLTPSLWLFVTAAVIGPMAGAVLVPLGSVVALLAGAAVSALVIVALAFTAPVVRIADGTLFAGSARIEVRYLGDAVALRADEARHARGPGLDPRSWLLIRGSIEGLVVVRVVDDDDPVPSWVISSRTPDRLVAALRREQEADATRRTPGR